MFAAPQQRPRPLPLFLDLLRSETAEDPARMARALAGLRLYQAAPRDPRPAPAPIVAQAGRAVLRDHAPDGGGRPVIVVPSLINPPHVLDLAPDRSLLRWLAAYGFRPLLVDWGAPAPADRDLDLAAHVETMLLPLIGAIGADAALVGYCLGGTMALAAAALTPVARLGLIATPWRFAGFPDASRASMLALWAQGASLSEAMGLMPIEMLQAAFWTLDPARTVAKFERLDALDPAGIANFVAVEDWANDGPPLTLGVARTIFDGFFRDDLSGTGAWRVGGRAIDAGAIACPVLNVISTSDRIVPAPSAPDIGERLMLALGHVGMIVGTRGRDALWTPLARWLAGGETR